MPVIAITIPMIHTIKDSPTLPVSAIMVLGVANIPVPMILLKIKKEALMTPICLRFSGHCSVTLLVSTNT